MNKVEKTTFNRKSNRVITKVDDNLKAKLVAKLVSYGFKFGGVVRDDSIKGAVEANLIMIDETSSGYEVKFRATQYALYEIANGYSKNRSWHNYTDFDSVFVVE